MDNLLKGKVIVISGGTKGIGRGIAIESAKQGADVVIGGRDEASAGEILGEIRQGGRDGIFVHTDLEKTADCARMFSEAVSRFGRVDGFVNYAGITPAATLLDETEEQFDRVFGINVRAAFFCAQQAVRQMQKNGGGSIVMFGSPHAWCGEKDRPAYACSKGALLTLTEHIARHYAADHIRCNYITTGWVPTEGELALRKKQGMNSEQLHEYAAKFIPAGRMQETEDHVPGIIYLLSDLSSMVTGSNLRVTGGFYI